MTPERQLKAMALLEEALDYPTYERHAFVQTACGDDDALRLEVESLLRSREQVSTQFLNTGALTREAVQLFTAATLDLAGQTLNHFTLLERLGSGGMGVVYLAQDEQLGRKVALKLLPPQALQNDASLRRFAREARAASALNHPNIVQIYEIGRDGERHYIAAEYVTGQTLRARLQAAYGRPLPLAETLSIAEQVTAALVAAHAAGIIHRDIKPENLMLRPDGVIKVLDFGIAKLMDRNDTGEIVGEAGHLSTEHGLVMGTPGYMSPEQARGQSVTEGTDLFSLGVLLYEMLTGQLPFQSATKADFFARLLTAEPPDVRQQRPDLPAAYANLLQRLLAKDSQERFASANEAAAALAQLPRQTASAWQRFVVQHLTRRKLAAAAVLFVAACAAVFAFYRYKQPAALPDPWSDPTRLKRTEIFSTKIGRDLSYPAFSPDGQWVAFDMSMDKTPQLFFMPRRGSTPVQLTSGDSIDRNPVWSPDGQRLAYFSQRSDGNGLWVIARTGGAPTLLRKLDSVLVEVIGWRNGASGEKLYYVLDHNVFALSLKDNSVQQLTHLPGEPSNLAFFSLSPDGTHLLYREISQNVYYLRLLTLGDQQPATLLSSKEVIYSPSWFPDGERIVYSTSQSGSSQPHLMVLASRQTSLLNFGGDDADHITVAPKGSGVLSRSQNQLANVYAIDLQGEERPLTFERGQHHLPMLSPDGKQLIYQASGGALREEGALFGKPFNGTGDVYQFGNQIKAAQWSPDGKWLAVVKQTTNQPVLNVYEQDGRNEKTLATDVFPPGFSMFPFYLFSFDFSWSPDSQKMVYVKWEARQSSLQQVDLSGTSSKLLSPDDLTQTQYYSPLFSPDGKRISFIRRDIAKQSDGASLRKLAVIENGQVLTLHETLQPLQMLGWSVSREEVFVIEGSATLRANMQDARVLACQLALKRCQPLAQLRQINLFSSQLSPDGRALAFVAHINGSNNLVTLSLATRQMRTLTNNRDAGVFYAGLRWMPDGQGLLFSKQTSFEVLTLIEPR